MDEVINTDTHWRKITIKGIVGILIFYCVLHILGILIIFTITTFVNLDPEYINKLNPPNLLFNKSLSKFNYHNISLIGSLGSTLVGSSIFYIRKVYKLCIEKQFSEPTACNNDKLQSLGTIIYFVFRPFFAIAFSILVVIGLEAGMFSLSSQKPQLGDSFPNICIFVNFFIGFSSGQFLKSLEKKSESLINTLLNTRTKTDVL